MFKNCNRFCFLILLLFGSIAGYTRSENIPLWQLSPKQFFATNDAKQIINIEHPDHYLLSISIYHATNQLRQKKGLQPLQPMRILYDAGMYHLKAMKQFHFFAHENPINKKERTLYQRVKNRGGAFNMVGENLAQVLPMRSNGKYLIQYDGERYVYFDRRGRQLQLLSYGELGQYIVDQWYESSGHRKNLLNPDYKYIGIATLVEEFDLNDGRVPSIYAVQEFAA